MTIEKTLYTSAQEAVTLIARTPNYLQLSKGGFAFAPFFNQQQLELLPLKDSIIEGVRLESPYGMSKIDANEILLGEVSSEVQKLLCSIENYIRESMNPEGYIGVILTSKFRGESQVPRGWHQDTVINEEQVGVNIAVSIFGSPTLFYNDKRAVALPRPEDIKTPFVGEVSIWTRGDNGALHSAPNKTDEEFHTPRLTVIYSFDINGKIPDEYLYNNHFFQNGLLQNHFFKKEDKILDEINTYVETVFNIKTIKEQFSSYNSNEWGFCRRAFTEHDLVNSKNDFMLDSSESIVEILASGAADVLQFGYDLAGYIYQ